MLVDKFLNVPKSEFYKFDFLCQYILEHDCLEIAALCMVHSNLKKEFKSTYELREDDIRKYANSTYEGIFKTPFVGGATLWDCISDFKYNIDKYIWLYNILEDQQSKDTLHKIMLYRLFLDLGYLEECFCDGQYFIPDILPKRENAVFVDCGAYDGMNTKEFMGIYGEYFKIYTYEPVPENYKVVCESLRNYTNIVSFNKGVSNKSGELRFTSHMPNPANRIHPYGDVIVKVSTLDEDIDEPVTFIKMDIEGAEQSALLGAKNHIINDNPQLAICVYHTIEDLWKIPQIIYSYNNNQKFYLRYHGHNNQEEIVFYANPYGDNDRRIDNEYIGKENVDERLTKMNELTKTAQEGISYALLKLYEEDYTSCKDMLSMVREALSVCINNIDDIVKKL